MQSTKPDISEKKKIGFNPKGKSVVMEENSTLGPIFFSPTYINN